MQVKPAVRLHVHLDRGQNYQTRKERPVPEISKALPIQIVIIRFKIAIYGDDGDPKFNRGPLKGAAATLIKTLLERHACGGYIVRHSDYGVAVSKEPFCESFSGCTGFKSSL